MTVKLIDRLLADFDFETVALAHRKQPTPEALRAQVARMIGMILDNSDVHQLVGNDIMVLRHAGRIQVMFCLQWTWADVDAVDGQVDYIH